MHNLQIMSAEVCPFAQRTLILFAEKGLDYDLLEVDLSDKPDWFEKASPYSKVPVLIDGDTRVYESSIINEYIDEKFPRPPMMPEDPAKRAAARIWIDYDNVKFVPLFYKILLAESTDRRREFADALTNAFRFLESEALNKRASGPYWLGDEISLADMAIFPHFERLPVLGHYRGISIPPDCGALREWSAAVGERPCFRKTMHDADYHIAAYTRYADGTANGSTARDMRT